MTQFAAVVIIAAALLADLIIEISAELSADTLLDTDAGAVVEFAPGPPTEIVDLAPQASIRWQ